MLPTLLRYHFGEFGGYGPLWIFMLRFSNKPSEMGQSLTKKSNCANDTTLAANDGSCDSCPILAAVSGELEHSNSLQMTP